jgi:hypothetical protein
MEHVNEGAAKAAIVTYVILIGIVLVMLFSAFSRMDSFETDFPEPTPVPQMQPRLLLAEPAAPVLPAEQAVIEDPAGEVFWSDVPRDWKVCVNEARVYSNPGINDDWYLYSLYDETPVMVRELDSSRTFAMIEPARYVKFTDLCRP